MVIKIFLGGVNNGTTIMETNQTPWLDEITLDDEYYLEDYLISSTSDIEVRIYRWEGGIGDNWEQAK